MIKNKKFFSFNKKEIQEYFKVAKLKCRNSGLKLLQAPIKNKLQKENLGKLLIIIPGKSGNAVQRNKIKRQIKVVFFKEELYKKPIISILFVYKPAIKLTFHQIKEFLIKCI
ncbi:hypothetical protein GF322_01115 [Candidatus Dependentiae bacterium]|nr:hypothetical protein [Candidatus Dependentiae bacterium]